MRKIDKQEFETIVEIAKRAEYMSLVALDRFTILMDLELAAKEFNLRLEELLNAPNFDFAHDIVGIQKNIDRKTKTFKEYFLPRYWGKEGEANGTI